MLSLLSCWSPRLMEWVGKTPFISWSTHGHQFQTFQHSPNKSNLGTNLKLDSISSENRPRNYFYLFSSFSIRVALESLLNSSEFPYFINMMHGQLLNSSNFCIEEKTCPFMATGRLKNHFLVWYNCTSNRGHKNLIQSYSLVGWTRLDSVTIGRQQHLVWINSWEAVTMTNSYYSSSREIPYFLRSQVLSL